MKAKVNKDICIGCGLCTSLSPDIFRMDDDGTASVKVDKVPADRREEAKDAEAQCPVTAIEVDEE